MLNQSEALDLAYHALADPTRRDIVGRLSLGPLSVSEIARPLPMSLPAVMQHLAVLEGAGLVSSVKQGRVRTCQLDRQAITRAENWLSAQRGLWERRLDRLGAYLDEMNPKKDDEDANG